MPCVYVNISLATSIDCDINHVSHMCVHTQVNTLCIPPQQPLMMGTQLCVKVNLHMHMPAYFVTTIYSSHFMSKSMPRAC